MQFQFKVTIGSTEITVVENAESQAEFVEKVSFFSGLPTKGPNGETDLKFLHRITKEGYNYYSIVSESANQEYNLGQSQKEPGQLFGKGWAPCYQPEAQVGNTVGGIGDPQSLPQQVNQAQQYTPQPGPLPAGPGVANAPQVAQQPVQAPAQGVPQQVASNVLQKFGIS